MSVDIMRSQMSDYKKSSKYRKNNSNTGLVQSKNIEFPAYSEIIDQCYVGIKPKGYRLHNNERRSMMTNKLYGRGCATKKMVNQSASVNHSINQSFGGSENNLARGDRYSPNHSFENGREKSGSQNINIQNQKMNDYNTLYKYKLDGDVSEYLKEFIQGKLRLEYFYNKEDVQSNF